MCAGLDDEFSYQLLCTRILRCETLNFVPRACLADSCHGHTSSEFAVLYLVQPNEMSIFMIKETMLHRLCKQTTKRKAYNLGIQMNH